MKAEIDYVELWLDRKCESVHTKDGYSDGWKRFEEFGVNRFDYNPRIIVSEWRRVKTSVRNREQKIDKFKDSLRDFVESYRSYLKTLDLSPLTIKYYLSVIQSFFKSWEIPVNIELPKRAFVKFHNKDITKEELKQILEHANIRDKCFFILMTESGQRPDTLVKLQYKHISHDFENGIVPMRIELPSAILKYRVPDRWTFIGKRGYKILKEYLRTYLPLKDEDYVFRPKRGKSEKTTTTAFSMSFNRKVQKLKLAKSKGKAKPKSLRLYCLRKYFRNNLKGVDSGFINFWMGHAQDSDMHYISTDVERHREEYTKGYPSLRIYEPIESSKVQELEIKLDEAYKTIGQLQQDLMTTKEEILEEMFRKWDEYVEAHEKEWAEQRRKASQPSENAKQSQTKEEKT